MGAIALTVVSINGNVVAPTIYGFDIDEISQPISNDGTYSLVTVRTYGRLNPTSSFIETRYEVQENLSTIVSLSDQLFLADVIFHRGTGADYAVSYQRVFPIDNVRTIFNPDILGTQFNFYENENLLPVFYEVSQTVLQIISQLSPTGTFWALNGNTVGAIKTLGTIDNYDLPIITNNVEVARFDTNGDLGIGTNPSYRLDVDSAGTILTAIMRITNNTNSFKIFTSNASPETVITGDRGDICVVNNGVNGELYIKQTGVATNTGWVSLFINITAGTGISVSGTYPNITITNTAPDQIVSLTAGTGISVSGTYPSFTITNTSSGGGGGLQHGTATGTDTYSVTITGVTSYSDGDAYLIRFTNGNTTGCTLNINGIGAVTLYRNNDGALIGGDIWDGAEMICIYNSTTLGFQCIGTSPNSLYSYVTNDDSVTITKGQVVYAFSGTGDRMTVKLAYNTSDATSAKTVGVVLSNSIAANQKGIIIMQGLLDGLSILPTATYTDGDTLYLGVTPGSFTNVKPYAPNHLVYVATVTTASNGSAGRMYVKVQNGYELDEIHDVDLISTPPINNDVLTYVTGASNLWKPRSISTILGYTPVQSVSGVSPISSSGGTTPAISIQDAQADNTTKGACTFDSADFNATAGLVRIDYVSAQAASSTNKGFLTSSDWTTFNSKLSNNAWVDYSALSTVTGWSSFTSKEIRYKIVGDTLFVKFFITGTSNSTGTTFTLPYVSTNFVTENGIRAVNNGTNYDGFSYIVGITNLVNAYYWTSATVFSNTWTASNNKLISGQFFMEIGSTSLDYDAQNFISYAGITDATQKSAINQLVLDLKAYNLWNKITCIYPWVGGTATAHSYNLKNPGLFQLTFTAGWTHTSNGGTPANAYASSGFIPSTFLTANNTHLAHYIGTDTAAGNKVEMAVGVGGSLVPFIGLYSKYTGNLSYSNQYNLTTNQLTISNTDARGFYIGSRTSSTLHKLYKNGTVIGTDTNTNSNGLPTLPIPIGCLNSNGSFTQYTDRQFRFNSWGEGFNDTEALNYRTAVQAFQTTLGRQV